ncbi:MAG: LysR family transcriptional regulator [Rhodospirillales bacterium]|nr:LysR family transcriptional regulator [Rhodospirillales bacterium]
MIWQSASRAGVGIIQQPTFLIGQVLQQGRLMLLLPRYRLSDIDILATYTSRRHLSAKVRVTLDFLA